jgi:Integrase zinc binding domain
MILRWFDTLQEYDMTIIHRPGIQHVLPDALSRLYPPVSCNNNVYGLVMLSGRQVDPKMIIKDLYDVKVPQIEERHAIITNEHNKGHFGVKTIINNLWKDMRVYWKGIRKDVQDLVQDCEACQRYNYSRHGFHPMRSVNATFPMDHCAMDTL